MGHRPNNTTLKHTALSHNTISLMSLSLEEWPVGILTAGKSTTAKALEQNVKV